MRRGRVVLGRLLALSRAPHALLDAATPAAAALLWWGGFPPLWRVLVGLPTAVAGYFTVYALNDLTDAAADRRKLASGVRSIDGYLDAALHRHPVAAGLLSPRLGVAWAAGLGAVAAIGSAVLNPYCLVILALGCVLEMIYCRLAPVTSLRALVSGVVKTLGPVAAVFALDPTPSLLPLSALVVWFFLFEIGGQNIPADWTDLDEDRRIGARTLPVTLGELAAGRLSLAAVALSLVAGVVAVALLRPSHPIVLASVTLAAGVVLLLLPALRVLRTPGRADLFRLFNRASLYPLSLLIVAGGLSVFDRVAGVWHGSRGGMMSPALNIVLGIIAFVGTAALWEAVAYLMHKYVMHGVGWFLHEDHHRRHGRRFQKNDVYALFFALCSFLLIFFGLKIGVVPMWAAGFGVALYGVGYVSFHEILFHKRVRWLQLTPKHPYLQRIVNAHRVHHKVATRDGASSFGFLWAPRKHTAPPG